MNSQILFKLSFVDYSIFVVLFLITFLFVLYGNRKKHKDRDSLLDYLVLGRQLTLPFFITNLVASWYGGIFGVTKIAFESGIYNFLTQGLFWYVAYLIFAFFLVDKISMYNAMTLPDLTKKLFGKKSSQIASVLTFFNILPVSYVISLGLFFEMAFGLSFLHGMILGILAIYIYSLFGGGMRGIVFADFIYAIVMCTAVAILFFYSWYIWGGYTYLIDKVPATHFTLTGGESISSVLVWGFIALATLVDPCFYQTCLCAKSPQIAKKGIFISIVIWFCFDICTTFGSIYARAYMPTANPKHAYLLYGMTILPEGLKGLFLAGILATIVSTADSFLLITANTLSYDIMGLRGKKMIWMNHFSFIFIAVVSILLSLYFEGDIKMAWKTLGSYMAASLLIPMLFGFKFPKLISDNTFFIASLLSIVGITWWRYQDHHGFTQHIDAFYIGLLISFLVIMVSLRSVLLGFIKKYLP
ncbi:MAG: sodium:phosphate symporter [Bdellovibrionales bacterium RIFOXYB1_FULL_37_110]|nr:MAG: sodium:phosphate symporter [Bdellovibrionales bacterium RIFOXYA1_FULL_38_20]OFZ49298.1 MAG: sodium:phosphate symporter [Bdellovibrionales bacterium RIFOXYC1_FULL_37_79]OFZ57754.1 MAG: sodium:phosphate symporter [Bdellovibrionales bacterium RIFOXYB1_FULL_37_110]OFZ61559.1 MAG: sodium:phosphate symporter [Bdellovibrionales bacterium RIFOXYD1_FULL_36_51]